MQHPDRRRSGRADAAGLPPISAHRIVWPRDRTDRRPVGLLDQPDDPTVRTDSWRTYGGCSFTVQGPTLELRPVAPPGVRFDPDRIGLDHLSLRVGSVDDLHAAAGRLTEAGIEHGEVTDLPLFGLVILCLQDPDGIDLEVAALRG